MTGTEIELQRVLLAAEGAPRAQLLRVLRQANWDVVEADDRTRLWALLQGGTVDAVVLDVSLPGGAGLDVLREIRGRGLPLPVVVVGAGGGVAPAVEAMRAGADDYLAAPFGAETLLRAVARATRERGTRAAPPPAPPADERRKAEKMEVLGRLTSMVAHDLNNLMTVLLSCSGVLRERSGQGAVSAEVVEQIEKVAVRAVGLTRQLLAYSRRQRVRSAPADLNALVTDLSGLLQRLLPESIELRLDLQPGLGGAKVPAGHAEQVLMNLVLNAR